MFDFNKAFEKEVDVIMKAKTEAILQSVVNSTPIDTGKARNSWSISKEKDRYLVSNTVDYIEELNGGSSEQAGPYFIESAILGVPGTSPDGAIVVKK